MLFNLFHAHTDQFALFNLLRYLTVRSGAACLTALVLSFLLGTPVIRWLKSVQRGGQPIRLDGPERHLLEKQGTPTMGGVLILLAAVGSTLLWTDLRNAYVWAVLFCTLGYGAIGFADDYMKLSKRNTKGVSARGKLIAQVAIGLVSAIWIATAWAASESRSINPMSSAEALNTVVSKPSVIAIGRPSAHTCRCLSRSRVQKRPRMR